MATIQTLAADMGVSESQAAEFVEGVRLQMAHGLSLDDAIRAHADMWRKAFDVMAEAYVSEGWRGQAFRDMAVSMACDAFYPEAV